MSVVHFGKVREIDMVSNVSKVSKVCTRPFSLTVARNRPPSHPDGDFVLYLSYVRTCRFYLGIWNFKSSQHIWCNSRLFWAKNKVYLCWMKKKTTNKQKQNKKNGWSFWSQRNPLYLYCRISPLTCSFVSTGETRAWTTPLKSQFSWPDLTEILSGCRIPFFSISRQPIFTTYQLITAE